MMSEITPPLYFSPKSQNTTISQVEEVYKFQLLYDYSTKVINLFLIRHTGLKRKYTFDNFIQGDGNVWAKSAALAVSEDLAFDL